MRKTVIHAETILLGYAIFLYLFSCLPAEENPLDRIRMYNSLAPDGYNEETVELMKTDPGLQVMIGTQAFTNGMNAKPIVDSIGVKMASTQNGSEQRGGRAARDEKTAGRRIIFTTPTEMRQAKKVFDALPSDLNLANGFPAKKLKQSDMDPAKAYFLMDSTCRVACINRIYQNPELPQSVLDCIAANRPHPCDLCCKWYHIPDDPRRFLESSNLSLSQFIIPASPESKKSKKSLTKKEMAAVTDALVIFERKLWLDEHTRVPHRYFPRAAYLPKSLVNLLIDRLFSINSYPTLEMILSSVSWQFQDSQGQNLYDVICSTQATINANRKERKSKKKKPARVDVSDDEVDLEDMLVDVSDKENTVPAATKSARGTAPTHPETNSARKRPANKELPKQLRAKRAALQTVAETSASYGPAYSTRSTRSRRGEN
ncbi:hypothetical protein AAF712_015668 [Marasmius tenuissimus]|uniref:Helicase C-terminal domain-containing protein n=1 Tax=Marasmius tenuissimus TaxID=585030 RepID=A0ABR2Z7N1_9AGAR